MIPKKYVNISKNLINVKDENNMSQSLKTHFTKLKIPNNIIFEFLKIKPKICNFCNINECTQIHKFIYEITNIAVNITGIEYNQKYMCDHTLCKQNRKHINPNSIEFVRKAYNIASDEEALKIIKERNSSPFYKENYQSYDDYKNYQSLTARYNDPVKLKTVTDKATYSKSLESYQTKYGIEEGFIKWSKIQDQKAITLNNMIKVHGIDKGTEIYNAWKKNVISNKENFIRRYGEYEGNKRYEEYNIKIQNCSIKRSGMYGVIHHTDKNEMLRSKNEFNFYKIMKKYGLHNYEYIVFQQYENSLQKSDFYFVDINTHIEIAGMGDEEYLQKMKQKEKDFGAWIIIPNRRNYERTCIEILKLYGGL